MDSKKLNQLLIWLLLLMLIGSMACAGLGYYAASGITLIAVFLVTALTMARSKTLKSYSFTSLILAAATAAMTFPDHLQSIAGYPLKSLIVPLLQFITFGVGATLRFEDFRNVVKTPGAVAVGIVCQFTIMPFVGWTIAKTFHFEPEIAAGIILVASCPSGLASNVMAYLAKANLALSVTLTTFATLLAPLLTPFLMKYLGGQFIPVSFTAMLWSVTKILVFPILAGLIFHHLFRRFSEILNRIMPKLSMIGIAFIIVVITAAGQKHLLEVGGWLILASFLQMTIAFFLGYLSSRLLRFPETDCRTIAIEVGMQNSGLAAGLAALMGKIATVGLAPSIFSPLMNIVFSVIASWWGNKSTSPAAK